MTLATESDIMRRRWELVAGIGLATSLLLAISYPLLLSLGLSLQRAELAGAFYYMLPIAALATGLYAVATRFFGRSIKFAPLTIAVLATCAGIRLLLLTSPHNFPGIPDGTMDSIFSVSSGLGFGGSLATLAYYVVLCQLLWWAAITGLIALTAFAMYGRIYSRL